MKEDYDKTLDAIELVANVVEDTEKAKDEESAGGEKITWGETLGVVTRNAVPAVKSLASLKEIGREVLDTDSDEAKQATELILQKFGDDPNVIPIIQKISAGTAQQYEGIKELIAYRKSK